MNKNKQTQWHVITTPCWPCSFKANPPLKSKPNNATFLYKRTKEEAQKLCDKYNN